MIAISLPPARQLQGDGNNLLTAREAAAISHLLTHDDFAIHKRIEVRIWDSIQNGGNHIIYAGEITKNVIDALRCLGYKVTILQYEGKDRMLRISWEEIKNAKNS